MSKNRSRTRNNKDTAFSVEAEFTAVNTLIDRDLEYMSITGIHAPSTKGGSSSVRHKGRAFGVPPVHAVPQ